MHSAMRFALAGLALLATGPAWGQQLCHGSYSATLLRPLPAPLVVGLDIRDDSPGNLDLAARFKSGLQKAGVATTGTPTAQLNLAVTLTGGPQRREPFDAPANSFGWMGGGINMQEPNAGRFGRPAAPPPMLLQIRATLSAAASGPVQWVAVLQCSMRGADDRALAFQIGSLIGQAIGKRVENKPF